MPHRAPWRTLHGDPRTWPGWLTRDLRAPALWIANRLEKVMMIVALCALVRGERFAAMMCLAIASVPEQAVTLLASLWGGRFLLGPKSFVPRPLPIDDLLTFPPTTPPFPCRVEVSKRGTTLGSDMGVVSFVDGWLHFEGYRTSFSLRRCDVSRRSSVRLEIPEGIAIDFEPDDWLAAGDLIELDFKKRFETNLESWMRSDSPAGEPVLPPLVFHPSGVLRAWSNLAVATTSCAVFLGFLTWLSLSTWAVLLMLPFLQGLFRAVRDVARVCRAVRTPRPLPAVE